MALPDPRRSYFVYVSGIKGSGKSEYCKHFFYPYPLDRCIIDVTHDVTESLRKDGIPHRQITKPIPGSWPDWMREADHDKTDAMPDGRLTLVYRPDMGDPEVFDDMDRVVGMCLRGGGPGKATLLWLDEIGEVTNAHKTGPGMRRGLHHGRHDDLSMLMAGPRARDVNPLCIGQADKVVTFRTLNKYDREALAGNMGIDQGAFDEMNKALKKYEHSIWERETEEIHHYGPLPLWRPGRNVYPEVPS